MHRFVILGGQYKIYDGTCRLFLIEHIFNNFKVLTMWEYSFLVIILSMNRQQLYVVSNLAINGTHIHTWLVIRLFARALCDLLRYTFCTWYFLMIFVNMRNQCKLYALLRFVWTTFDVECHWNMITKIVEVATEWNVYYLKLVFNGHWIC